MAVDDSDEWLFSSMNKYEDLYQYELIQPTRTIAFVTPGEIAVGGCLSTGFNELLFLSAPGHLRLTGDEQDLCGERDFFVIKGALTPHGVDHIETGGVGRERTLFVMNEAMADVELWSLANEDSDVIEKLDTMKTGLPEGHTCRCLIHDKLAICGSTGPQALLFDVNSLVQVGSIEWPRPITCAGFVALDGETFATVCQSSGLQIVWDARVGTGSPSLVLEQESTSKGDRFAFAVITPKEQPKIAVISDKGQLTVFDIRQSKAALECVDLGLSEPTKESNLCLQSSSHKPNQVSISGFGHCVLVLDWSTQQQLFKYDGHEEDATPLYHQWYPWKEDMIFSSSSDGSLHAWHAHF